MRVERIRVGNIPSIIWGENSNKIFIAVHGNMSSKEDEVIKIFADDAVSKGYQVLSFDLPEHGERKEDTEYLCKVQNCMNDLKQVIEFAKTKYDEINLWACSMGAYFSLLTYKNEEINRCIFLSPVVDMKKIIDNMMLWSNTTEEELKEKQEIKTDFGVVLYWDYYEYVKNNPITKWNKKTCILYGDKDNMQDEILIKEFAEKYKCELTILQNGEHYFHTEEQLEFYKKWLEKVMPELRDLYDGNSVKTNKTYRKGETIPEGYYPMVVMVVIRNSKGEFLMQKRAVAKGGDWGVTGGHPKAGETPLEGIITEVKEELGLDFSDEKFIEYDSGCDGKDCYKMYFVNKDINIEDITIQEEELSEVRWFSMEELKRMVETGKLNEDQIACFEKVCKYLKK